MKIAITKAIIFNALLFFTLHIKAQGRDYVITNINDTLKCKFISYSKYKVDGSDKPKSVNVDEIKEYYLFRDNVINRAVYLPGHRRPQFAKVVEKGKLNLYEQISHYVYVDPVPHGMLNNYSITEWYIAKGTDTVKILKNSDFVLWAIFLKSKTSRKNDLAEMLSDNKDVYNKFITDDNFNFEQIRNLVHLYNTGHSFGSDGLKDYVIKKNKDTIFCEIEPGTFNTAIRYRVNSKDRFIKLDTTVTGYFLAKDFSTYLLKPLPKYKHREYVKCLVDGRINLYIYSLNNFAGDSAASLYASKGSGDLVRIINAFNDSENNEKKVFTCLISDDPSLCEKVKNNPCNFTAILNYVKMYNSEYLTNNKPAK